METSPVAATKEPDQPLTRFHIFHCTTLRQMDISVSHVLNMTLFAKGV